MCVLCRSLFVLLSLFSWSLLSDLHRFTDSDYPFGIFKLKRKYQKWNVHLCHLFNENWFKKSADHPFTLLSWNFCDILYKLSKHDRINTTCINFKRTMPADEGFFFSRIRYLGFYWKYPRVRSVVYIYKHVIICNIIIFLFVSSVERDFRILLCSARARERERERERESASEREREHRFCKFYKWKYD
jgi:hypothetical protein